MLGRTVNHYSPTGTAQRRPGAPAWQPTLSGRCPTFRAWRSGWSPGPGCGLARRGAGSGDYCGGGAVTSLRLFRRPLIGPAQDESPHPSIGTGAAAATAYPSFAATDWPATGRGRAGVWEGEKMASEPSKTEIQTLFKRLRAIPTNKVHEREACGVCAGREGLSRLPWGPREGEGRTWAVFLGVSARLDSAPDHLLIASSTRPASTVVPRTRVGPASRTVSSCALTAPGCTAPWVSISASSGGVSLWLLCFYEAGVLCPAGQSGDLGHPEFGVRKTPGRGPVASHGREPPVWTPCYIDSSSPRLGQNSLFRRSDSTLRALALGKN